MKFTFKKLEATGRYRSFQADHTDIKLTKKVCGSISEQRNGTYSVAFIVNGSTPDNPNCPWHWRKINIQFPSESAARAWIQENAKAIRADLDLYLLD